MRQGDSDAYLMSRTFFKILVFYASAVFTEIRIFSSLNCSSNVFYKPQSLNNFFKSNHFEYQRAGRTVIQNLKYFLNGFSFSVNPAGRVSNFEGHYPGFLRKKIQGVSFTNFKSKNSKSKANSISDSYVAFRKLPKAIRFSFHTNLHI